jgi:hypothetical protein
MTRVAPIVLMASLLAAPLWLAPGCSLQNRDGPVVTCADLECGRINACQDGIIAQCLDGETVRYVVCDDGNDEICEEKWQTPDAYRCFEFATDCEGCRPERVDGCATFGAGGQ